MVSATLAAASLTLSKAARENFAVIGSAIAGGLMYGRYNAAMADLYVVSFVETEKASTYSATTLRKKNAPLLSTMFDTRGPDFHI
jgi:hypothetical protein